MPTPLQVSDAERIGYEITVGVVTGVWYASKVYLHGGRWWRATLIHKRYALWTCEPLESVVVVYDDEKQAANALLMSQLEAQLAALPSGDE